MPSTRFPSVVALIGSVCGAALLEMAAPAWGQQVPMYPAPPQRMAPSVAPAEYPTAYPSNSAASPSAYPATDPSTYQTPAAASPSSERASNAAAPALSPYDEVLPGISASPGGGAVQASYEDPGPLYEPYGSPEAMTAAATQPAYVDSGRIGENFDLWSDGEPWTWQILPAGLMYKSYLAGGREPRIASQWVRMRNKDWMWDATLGGRVGMLRYGTDNALWPQGWQLDIEGAAFPRLDIDNDRDLVSCDYRFGIPLTTRRGCWETKLAYSHYCSHLGDEYMVSHPGATRINYIRDAIVLGLAFYLSPNLRLYMESDWAFNTDGGAKPWEFQFGADFTPAEPTGAWGAPFFAINGRIREANDFGGNVTVQSGWQWRGQTGHLCRIGMQYFNGLSDQCQFYNTFEEQIGLGLWYDY